MNLIIQAGENLVRFAAISVDGHSFFGRTGMGCILGSKNVKAICLKGDEKTKVADKDKVRELRKELTKKIAKATSDFAVEVKGIYIGGHDPRAGFGQALNFARGPAGPHHENANLSLPYWGVLLPELGIDKIPERFEMEGTEYLVAKYQDWAALYNSLVICRFMMEEGAMTFGDMRDCLNAITGWDMSLDDVARTTERIFTLERMVNVKFGLTKENDMLPKRILEATKEGPHSGKVPKIDSALKKCYKLRGWNEQGIPKKEKLEELGLL
ncbi:MAG: aldehyde ferredoxin oxidoreductase C-terminal domain-containing protein [Candidatus Aerophobetes bacterium]|nr:aldehyde ferredoxin oxidoreductase C-terminal domain-containing protein [Candidatus Aerophobetes bacterium]